MIKKSGAKKTSGKAPKKPLKKKAAAVSASPEKSAAKKTATGKVSSGGKLKKTTAVKKAPVVQKQKKRVQQSKKATLKQEPVSKKPAPKKAIKKIPAIITRKTAKETEALPKAAKPLKKIKGRPGTKRGGKEKSKGTKKTAGKVVERPIEKAATKKTEKAKISTPLKSAPKKVISARSKKAEPKKTKEPEKTESIKVSRAKLPAKKQAVLMAEEISQAKKAGLPKETRKEGKKVSTIQKPQEIKTDIIPADHHPAEITFPPSPVETLPSEYGENSITLMTVNPYRIFSFWEVREETLKIFRGTLHLRVYDVTGFDFDVVDAASFVDVAVGQRIGEMYLDVSPAQEYIADIGIVYNGIFIGIARSPRVSTPAAGVPGEEKFLPEGLDTGIRTGY
jgi:hypothetical protein